MILRCVTNIETPLSKHQIQLNTSSSSFHRINSNAYYNSFYSSTCTHTIRIRCSKLLLSNLKSCYPIRINILQRISKLRIQRKQCKLRMHELHNHVFPIRNNKGLLRRCELYNQRDTLLCHAYISMRNNGCAINECEYFFCGDEWIAVLFGCRWWDDWMQRTDEREYYG